MDHLQSIDFMRSQMVLLRLKKEEIATEANLLNKNIQEELKNIKNFKKNNSTDALSEEIFELSQRVKKIKSDSDYIEEVYSIKQNIDKLIDSSLLRNILCLLLYNLKNIGTTIELFDEKKFNS